MQGSRIIKKGELVGSPFSDQNFVPSLMPKNCGLIGSVRV